MRCLSDFVRAGESTIIGICNGNIVSAGGQAVDILVGTAARRPLPIVSISAVGERIAARNYEVNRAVRAAEAGDGRNRFADVESVFAHHVESLGVSTAVAVRDGDGICALAEHVAVRAFVVAGIGDVFPVETIGSGAAGGCQGDAARVVTGGGIGDVCRQTERGRLGEVVTSGESTTVGIDGGDIVGARRQIGLSRRRLV